MSGKKVPRAEGIAHSVWDIAWITEDKKVRR